MTVERSYKAPLTEIGGLTEGNRAQVVDALAAAIFVEWNVRNLLVWENVRRPHVRHWREDCPALRRAGHAKSFLIPREQVAEGRNCGTCIRLDAAETKRENERRRLAILALEPPERLALTTGDDAAASSSES